MQWKKKHMSLKKNISWFHLVIYCSNAHSKELLKICLNLFVSSLKKNIKKNHGENISFFITPYVHCRMQKKKYEYEYEYEFISNTNTTVYYSLLTMPT